MKNGRSKIPEHMIAKYPIDEKPAEPKGQGYFIIAVLALLSYPFIWIWLVLTNRK